MKSLGHKIASSGIFVVFYFLRLFPAIANEYLHASLFNVLVGFAIAFFFSSGRVTSRELLYFGFSPDNDFHKKMKRDWVFHSAILPTILVLLFPHPLTYLAGFFYASHVAFDLLNTRSWEGTQYTYIAVFLTTILFYSLIYSA